jgi:hypothetical protein
MQYPITFYIQLSSVHNLALYNFEDGDAPVDMFMSLPIMNMINGSCVYKKAHSNVVTFFNDQIILDDEAEFPHGTMIVSDSKTQNNSMLSDVPKNCCPHSQYT